MEIKLKPFVPNGEINPPSSKSYCHRYLICAFIANKPFTIYNFNFCDDTIATLNGLKELGGLFKIIVCWLTTREDMIDRHIIC